jgi:hypothetical protein
METTDRFTRIAARRAEDKARRLAAGTKLRWQAAKLSRGDLPLPVVVNVDTTKYETVYVEDLLNLEVESADEEETSQIDGWASQEDTGEEVEEDSTQTKVKTPRRRLGATKGNG